MPKTVITFTDWGSEVPPTPDVGNVILYLKGGKLSYMEDDGVGVPVFSEGTIIYQLSGTLVVGAGVSKFVLPYPIVIKGIFATVTTAPTGASVIVDVNLDGTTIFSTQANRPSISAGSTVGAETIPDVTAGVTADELTIDRDQVGSGTAGSGLQVYIRYGRS